MRKRIKKFIFIRRNVFFAALVLVAVFLVLPEVAHAKESWANNLFYGILKVTSGVFAGLFKLVLKLFLMLIRASNFMNVPGIQTGWKLLRDLGNMLFIMVMLAIAFGTILRIESYKWQRMLPKLVFAAIMVNFSKTIALILIDVGQVVMFSFVDALKNVEVANFETAFKMGVQGSLEGGLDGDILATPNIVLEIAARNILYAVAVVVVAAMSIVLLVRIIVLWVLVALSPIAFIADVLTFTQKYAKQWWSEFIKYVIIGPIFAFFLWFAFLFVGQGKAPSQTAFTSATISTESAAYNQSGTKLSIWDYADFAVAIGLLILGLTMAQKLGVKGSKAGMAVAKGAWDGARRKLAEGNVLKNTLKYTMFPLTVGAKLGGVGLKASPLGKYLGAWRAKAVGKDKEGKSGELNWAQKLAVFSTKGMSKQTGKEEWAKSSVFAKTLGAVAYTAAGFKGITGAASKGVDVGAIMSIKEYRDNIMSEIRSPKDRRAKDQATTVAKTSVSYATTPSDAVKWVGGKFIGDRAGKKEESLAEQQKAIEETNKSINHAADFYVDLKISEAEAKFEKQKADEDAKVIQAQEDVKSAEYVASQKAGAKGMTLRKAKDVLADSTSTSAQKADAGEVMKAYEEAEQKKQAYSTTQSDYAVKVEKLTNAKNDRIRSARDTKDDALDSAKEGSEEAVKTIYKSIERKRDELKAKRQALVDEASDPETLLQQGAEEVAGNISQSCAELESAFNFLITNFEKLAAKGVTVTNKGDGTFTSTSTDLEDQSALNEINLAMGKIRESDKMRETYKENNALQTYYANLYGVLGTTVTNVKDNTNGLKNLAGDIFGKFVDTSSGKMIGSNATVSSATNTATAVANTATTSALSNPNNANEVVNDVQTALTAAMALAAANQTDIAAQAAVIVAQAAVDAAQAAATNNATDASAAATAAANAAATAAANATLNALKTSSSGSIEDIKQFKEDILSAFRVDDDLRLQYGNHENALLKLNQLAEDMNEIGEGFVKNHRDAQGKGGDALVEHMKNYYTHLSDQDPKKENLKKIEEYEKLSKTLRVSARNGNEFFDIKREKQSGNPALENAFGKATHDATHAYYDSGTYKKADQANQTASANDKFHKFFKLSREGIAFNANLTVGVDDDKIGKAYDEMKERLKKLHEEKIKNLEKEIKIQTDAQKLLGVSKVGNDYVYDHRKRREENEKHKEDVDRIQSELMEARKTQLRYRTETDVEERRHIQRLVEEEASKITTENSDELIAEYFLAEQKKDQVRGMGILKKLMKDANFNDMLDRLKLDTNMEGMNHFFDKYVIGNLGVKKQIALGLQNDMSMMAERVNHLTLARTIDVQGGKFIRTTPEKQTKAVLTEAAKHQDQIIHDANRLGYGFVNPRTGKFQLEPIGRGLLKMMAPEMARAMSRGYMNKNALMHLAQIRSELPGYVPELARAHGTAGEEPFMILMNRMAGTWGESVERVVDNMRDLFRDTFVDKTTGESVFRRYG